MMSLDIMRALAGSIPFIVLCLVLAKMNLRRERRVFQWVLPVVAVLYCWAVMWFSDDVTSGLQKLFDLMGHLDVGGWMVFIVNAMIVVGFLVIKAVSLPLLVAFQKSHPSVPQAVGGRFYDYDAELERWFIKARFSQAHTYWRGFYYAAIIVSTIIFIASQGLSSWPVFKASFYPVYGIIILGEITFFLSGITRETFLQGMDIYGDEDDAAQRASYSSLRRVFKEVFGSRVLFDGVLESAGEPASVYDAIESLRESNDQEKQSIGDYFFRLRQRGMEIDGNMLQASVELVDGHSVVVYNPFYSDVTAYIVLPVFKNLLRYRKCLVLLGRDSAAEDVCSWLQDALDTLVSTPGLWKVGVLDAESTDLDVAIMKPSDIHNMAIYEGVSDLLSDVGMVIALEPSRILATAQLGIAMVLSACRSEGVVLCALDRNCDGLIDALSHAFRVNLTEVWATQTMQGNCSQMVWDGAGEYMHHQVISHVSRYLGIGTEISAVALKNQIAHVWWVSSEKFPVTDMKWIAGQYSAQLCRFAELPLSQESLNQAIGTVPDLWSVEQRKNAFFVVEDEFHNYPELVRLFGSRSWAEGFVNVIADDYLLRDYMIDNEEIFDTDPKAIPTIVADFARTERNTVLRLLMMMRGAPMMEETLSHEFDLAGIDYTDPVHTFIELVRKHCGVSEVELSVKFVEVEEDESVVRVPRKFIEISEDSQLAKYSEKLVNAYYITEDEVGADHFIGGRLFGHVYQALLPGQFVTYAGKYYEVAAVTHANGVVLRRAAEYIVDRRRYRQLRTVTVETFVPGASMGDVRTIDELEITRGYANFQVSTTGYLELPSYGNLVGARKITLDGIPQRSYRGKSSLCIHLPGASAEVRATTTLLLNEIFRTTYPEAYPYIYAVTAGCGPLVAEGVLYGLIGPDQDDGVYIIEDSEIDLGLVVSVDRNLDRYFGIIEDYLEWTYQKKHRPASNGAVGLDEDEASEGAYEPWTSYLQFGRDDYLTGLDVDATKAYFAQRGYDNGPLPQARAHAQGVATFDLDYDPFKEGAHFCDFCGIELVGGEYYVLADGRERCNQCDASAVRSVDQFREIFNDVLKNMGRFYGIAIKVPVKIRMVDAKTIARHLGEKFVATPGMDARTVGFASPEKDGTYSLFIENGSPRLATVSTIAHELTHIWQFRTWSEKLIEKTYGKKRRLEIYEGMAKWVEIQYDIYLKEFAYAKRQEIITRCRDDEYGRGFVEFDAVYPLDYSGKILSLTPFTQVPPLPQS